MKKILLLFFIFLSTINANELIDVSLDSSIPIYKSIELSNDVEDIADAINNPSKFKKVKYFRRHIRKKFPEESTWYKIDILNSSNQALKKEIFTRWKNFTSANIYLVENEKVIFYDTLKQYNNFQVSNAFEIKSNQKLKIYINIKTEKRLDDFYYLYIISENTLANMIEEKSFFTNGIFLGLLIAMMMYNFFMYFSMKIKSYLYLAFYQLSIVIYISDIRYWLIALFEDFQYFSYIYFRIIASSVIIVFSILFTKEFLNTKKNMPFLNLLLIIFLFLHVIFQFMGAHSVNYIAALYSLYLVAGFISLKQGNKYALFFILGFAPTVLFHCAIVIIKFNNLNIYYEYQSIIQILSVIEAFTFSMALYLKLKQTVEEKEQAKKDVIEKEKMIFIQSKFATIGEMIGNIAHQWRQPLNDISSINSSILAYQEHGKLTDEILLSKISESSKQLKYMSSTIEDFMNFFSHKNKKTLVSLNEVCDHTLLISKTNLEKDKIKVHKKFDNEDKYLIKESELAQVMVILLNNSKDAFLSNKIKDARIDIQIKEKTIIYKDNAGGIPSKIIDKIFTPYFSTKSKKQGAGIGLYIAKQIIEKSLNGTICVTSIDNTTTFTINLENLKQN